MTLSKFFEYKIIKIKNDVAITTYRKISLKNTLTIGTVRNCFATTPINITVLVFHKDLSLGSTHNKQIIFKVNNESTKKKCKDLPKVNQNIQTT